MDKKKIDKKDQIILQQLEVIRTMSENSLNRMGGDFWGASSPLSEDSPFHEFLKQEPKFSAAAPEKPSRSTPKEPGSIVSTASSVLPV